MPHSTYLIVGSSHAALEAATAIRLHDAEGSITLLTRETRLPYSPTILPYIVSGRSKPDDVVLRDEAWLAQSGVALRRNSEVVRVDPATKSVTTAAGKVWTYDKLLLATGGSPVIPAVPGLGDVKAHVLHTMDDAIALRDAMSGARSAIVLGAGLCGMHVAEGMAKAGLTVSVLIRSRPLREYFSPRAGNLIQSAFAGNGAQMLVGHTPAAVERRGDGCAVTLDDGRTIAADLLMVGTGVSPAMGYLEGSGVETARGILADDRMRTNVADVWAAGDVAEARSFWGGKAVNGILPGAVEHGRIAGADMAQDAGVRSFPGGMGLNTYHYFEHHAVSVGLGGQLPDSGEFDIDEHVDAGREKYRRIVMKAGRLVGFASIDEFADPGVMWQLILRRTDLTPVKAAFLAEPQATARRLMSQLWR
ncbi:MAG TPA: FAD-dependent oxidoreductase [Acetobacteraceae bacterium]|nr:FAD-dependent oxidoreductase [Acetobacteraceae bacterium]